MLLERWRQTDKYAEAAKVHKCVRCKDRGGILMRTLASSNIPSESSPQIHSRPSPAVCVAGCHCCTGATGCPDGRLPRCHLTPSGHLPKKWMLRFFSEILITKRMADNKMVCSWTRELGNYTYGSAYKAQRGWRGLSCVASLFVSLFLPQQILPPNGENKNFQKFCPK